MKIFIVLPAIVLLESTARFGFTGHATSGVSRSMDFSERKSPPGVLLAKALPTEDPTS